MKTTTALKSHFIPHNLRAMALAFVMLFGVPTMVWAALINPDFENGSVGWTGIPPAELTNLIFTEEGIPIFNGTNFLSLSASPDVGGNNVTQMVTVPYGSYLEVDVGFITTSTPNMDDVGTITVNGHTVILWNPARVLPGISTGGFIRQMIILENVPGFSFETPFELGIQFSGTTSIMVIDKFDVVSTVPLPSGSIIFGSSLVALVGTLKFRRRT